MQNTASILELDAEARIALAKKHGNAALRLDDSGRKETAKTLLCMELAGDIGDKTVKAYCKDKGIDLSKLKGVYEIKRVAKAVADEEIDMDESQFDTAASSKLQILSRFFKDEHKDKLPEGVKLVVADAPAAEIRALLKDEDSGPALVVDDIAKDAPILTSEKVRTRLLADSNAALDGDPEVLKAMTTTAGRLFVALAESSGQNAHEIVAGVLEELYAAQAAEETAAAA
jgi:hypothetical protein